MDWNDPASDNFKWRELLDSSMARRRRKLFQAQRHPPESVLFNLARLVALVLQPIRVAMVCPVKVTSGYRSKRLNQMVGGSVGSQHMAGEAADISIYEEIAGLGVPLTRRAELRTEVEEKGFVVLTEPGDNYWIWLWLALERELPGPPVFDQAIHEWGVPGDPAWIHVSTKEAKKNRGQMMAIGDWTDREYVDCRSFADAVTLKCKTSTKTTGSTR